MKKVLSVALASAMVLGMGANAFAITYNTGSNDTADWPSSFKFDGSLFARINFDFSDCFSSIWT